ncbi:type VI secretion system protein TssA [Halarcobacter ebronensis]|uniref:Type VI secretion system protein TssA n=1 Tax=Halarcobacter ebronensis TaxID=1462615 RepID=A0A4Q0YAQ1_9BACT|nr:type VI secretion system protein TssA [Halarcobacter ebronensis]RXJ67332.1 type VI secretion system protein TssA [Halarcobacter ebronensis]
MLNELSDIEKCGIDCKYEDTYLLIEQEVDKEHCVTQEDTDWTLVYDNTLELLEKKTKDLKLASWWLFSSWKSKSWSGLESSLITFTELVEKFSVDLFPKSLKSKKNIILWLEETLTYELVTEQNKNIITSYISLYEKFLKLNLVLKGMLSSDEENFRKIINFIKPFYDEEKNREKQSLIKEENRQNIDTKTLSFEAITEISSDADATKILNALKKIASLLASYYRKNDFTNLKAIRISRFLSWIETDGLPYNERKRTSLYPPSELELDELKKLLTEEKYEEALFLAEEIIEVSPFWIDGHYHVHNIFEKTNNKNLSLEVKNSLLSFVKTNEGILDFYFVDDTAFASSRVKKWINEELKINSSEDEISNDNDFSKKIDVLFEQASSGKIKESMSSMAAYYNNASTKEEKFNWRLNHAQLAIEFGKKDIALALLEDLQNDIEKFNLDEWNPKLVSKVYSLILSNYTNVDIENNRLEEIYKRLCKSDIKSAFEIELK